MKLLSIYKNIVKETSNKQKSLNEISILLEKEIKVGDGLTTKLQSIKNNTLAANILKFLNSNQIKDTATVDYVDYNKDNEKLLTLGYQDRDGNTKERLVKIPKLMTYLGGDLSNIKGYELEDIINHLKKGDVKNLKLYKGDDILKIYHCENYDEGETMGSCMRHGYAQKYLEIYTNNPNQVQVLGLINPENGKIRGRALIWTMDNGGKFMDRVYTTNKQYDVEFNNFAEENNIERRTPSSDVTLEVEGEYDYYPYMDTFEYYEPSSGTLSDTDGGDYIHLQDTNGGSSASGVWSEVHEENIPEDEAIYVEHIEGYVYDHEIVQSWDGDEYLYRDSDDVEYINAGEYAGSYALSKDAVELYNRKTAVLEDAYHIEFGAHEGEYALGDDVVTTVSDETALYEDVVELTAGQHDGEYSNPEDVYVLLTGDEKGEKIHEDDLPDYENEGQKWARYNDL